MGERFSKSIRFCSEKCSKRARRTAAQFCPPELHNERKPMTRIGRPFKHMARMRAPRRPFSDPRAGRLLSAIEFAFVLSRGEPISPTGLVRSCYPAEHILGGLRSWHRSNVVRAAQCVAEPIGRASTRGRPLVWRAMPERMKARGLFLGAGADRTTASFGN